MSSREKRGSRAAAGLHSSVPLNVHMQLAKTPYPHQGATAHYTADPYAHIEKSTAPVYEGNYAPATSVTLRDLPPGSVVQPTALLDGKHVVNALVDPKDHPITIAHGMLPGPVFRAGADGTCTIPLHPLTELTPSDLATRLIHQTKPSMEKEITNAVPIGSNMQIPTANPKRFLAVAKNVGVVDAFISGNAVVLPATSLKPLRDELAARSSSKVPTPGNHGLSVLSTLPVNSVHVEYTLHNATEDMNVKQALGVHPEWDPNTHAKPPSERETMGHKQDSDSESDSDSEEEEPRQKKSKHKTKRERE